jgi:hypothetical protein
MTDTIMATTGSKRVTTDDVVALRCCSPQYQRKKGRLEHAIDR